MKKVLSVFLMFAFALLGVNTIITPANAIDVSAGTVIKGEGLSTLYYIGEDGKRYVFPNDKTYFSWFESFGNVVEVSLEDLYGYPLGGNVRYKPGNVLLKIQTDPKVYAVGQNGKLHWIKSEKIAKDLYGTNWNLLVDDVPDSFFTNYNVDEAIETDSSYDPGEEEEEIPTPSYNLGFKTRLQKQIKENIQERRCLRLETFITRVQNRLARFGIEAEELGSDYLDECFTNDNDSDDNSDNTNGNNKHKNRWTWHKAGKIDICHDGQTINVSMNSAKAHLAHGDTLGTCGTESSDDNNDGDDDVEALTITNLEVANATITDTSAIISWDTNLDSDSIVIYNIDTEDATSTEDNSTLTQNHAITLSNLVADTTYNLVVKSATDDETAEETISFTTLVEPDTLAPEISNILVATSTESATITWTTDENASGKVYYGETDTTVTTDVEETGNDTMSHSVEITGLATSTEYFFYVESDDTANNSATSSVESFVTGL